jgi:hypothetical protein
MKTKFRLASLIGLTSLACFAGDSAFAQGADAYQLGYNVMYIPRYEYINTMSMNQDAREYYAVFIISWKNNGNTRLPVNDRYEIATSKGEKADAGFHPMVKKHIESKKNFSASTGKLGWLNPGESKYTIAIFDPISDTTPSFVFKIRGLPGLDAQPDKMMSVSEYTHLKDFIVRDERNGRDPSIVWEKDPDTQFKNRYIAHWRQTKFYRAEDK